MTSITRPDELRTSNRGAILRAVRRNPAQSRTFLSNITGLSPATLSAISNDLINEGVLRESAQAFDTSNKSKRGRPSLQLTPNPSAALTIAGTLSLNEITLMLVDYSGAIVYEHCTHLGTQTLSRTAISRRVVTSIHKAIEQSEISSDDLTHIELAFQGVTDVTNGILMWSPILKHKGIPLKDTLQAEFKVSVSIKNNCNMIARALSEQKHEELGSTFAALLFSHGIGMGVLHDNRLISGSRSSATEFGHMLHRANGALCRCGKHGCIEAYAADYAIWRRANRFDPGQTPDENIEFSSLQPLIEQARKRNGPERKAFVEAGLAIGTGLGNLFTLLDSFPVAVVGPITEAMDLMEAAIREGIQHGVREDDSVLVPLLYFPDDRALLREGCIQTALDAVDLSCFVSEPNDVT